MYNPRRYIFDDCKIDKYIQIINNYADQICIEYINYYD